MSALTKKEFLRKLAHHLRNDIASIQPSPKLTRALQLNELPVPNAYLVNDEIRRIREQNGAETHVGYKIGCTGETVRRKLGISEAVFGNLWGDSLFFCVLAFVTVDPDSASSDNTRLTID